MFLILTRHAFSSILLMLAFAGAAAAQPAPTTTILGSSASPSTHNQPVTFSAFVSGDSQALGGTVTFSSDLNGTLGAATLDPFAGAGRALGAGSYHTCAVTGAGGVQCWGYNAFGQLGNGSNSNSIVPVNVTGLASGAVAVAGGGYHTCILTSTGGVNCWGTNRNGELGNGTSADSNVPVAVSGLDSGIMSLAAGLGHTCALTASGGVKCWGFNAYGQLGAGSNRDSNVPVDVSGLGSGVVALTAGGLHTCALTATGGIKCWGYNAYGQLGNGSNTNSNVPVNVSDLGSGVIALAAGDYHACALISTGGVKCWGYNGLGQLGNGSSTSSNVPVDVSGLASGAAAVTAGDAHSCALTSGGGVKCWGSDAYGQLGDGTTADRYIPVDVSGLASGAAAITAGSLHTCALISGGGVIKCWGYNGYGQLGDGSTTNRVTPVIVLNSTAILIGKASLTTSSLTAGSHSITASYGGDGTHSSSNGSFVQQVLAHVPHDFNGDAKSDILWRNTSGELGAWFMNGSSVTVAGIGNVPTSWSVVGQRDVNGDDKTDILWLNSSGEVGMWLMNGAAVTPVGLGNVGTTWSVVGTGDFDGDARGDVFWRNTSGDVGIWFMNGSSVTAAGIGNVPAEWSVVGQGDFDGDGKTDILWRKISGDLGIWLMNGTSVTPIGLGNVGTEWSVVGTGDFDRDGKADILWRNSSGDMGIWFMNGGSYTPAAIGNLPLNWSVASIGDYDGDGRGDILLRSSSNDIGIWFMNGATVTSAPALGNVGPSWLVQNAASN